jgi:hypothetical protein
MANWRDRILAEFTPGVGRPTLVADPDRLLAEPKLSEALDAKGFETLLFEEPVAFRYAYESKYRSRQDAGQLVDLIVLQQGDLASLSLLPYDLLARSRRLSFSLAELFPNLSYPVLTALEPQYFDLLYAAQAEFGPGVLGENATKDFVLRHVFEMAAELIKSEADLLRALLRRHYRFQVLPPLFASRLVQILAQSHRFDGWPLATLFDDRNRFFAFLQERWPVFLSRFLSKQTGAPAKLEVAGPAALPFEHADVRVYVDNLFVEGLLQPVAWPGAESLAASWFTFGIRRDPNRDRTERFAGLLPIVERDVPPPDARHGQWLAFAETWAQLISLGTQIGGPADPEQATQLADARHRVDSAFKTWLEKRFGGLHNLPATPPIAVHHIARHLANRRGDGVSRIALIVVDGLALDQWFIVREQLSAIQPKWTFDEGAVFAWIPTVTSISRQTIFAGKAPLYFPSSVYSTEKEASLWSQFWADRGVAAPEVRYLKGLGEPSSLQAVNELASVPKLSVLGLVVDKVDRIMHGMELGTAGMHNQVRQWANEGFLASLCDRLLSSGFTVYLTSDHGNVEATGCGRPKEGSLAETRGERVRIYSDEILRTAIAAKFPGAVPWKPIGLPTDFLPLLAPDRRAFVLEGERTVAHGGITLEEVVVPFVRVVGASQ